MTKVTLPDKPPRRWWWWWLWALALVISSTHTKRPSSATFELVFVSLFLPNLLSNAFPSPSTRRGISFTLSTTLNWTCNWVNRAGNAFAFSTRGYHHRYVYPSRGRLSSSLMMSRLAYLASSRLVHYICTIRNVCAEAWAQFGYPILAALSLWIVYSLAKGMSGPESHAYFYISLIALMRNKLYLLYMNIYILKRKRINIKIKTYQEKKVS